LIKPVFFVIVFGLELPVYKKEFIMMEPMIAKIVELLPNREAKVHYPRGEEEIVSLEICGCASLGDTVFIRNSLVLYKLNEPKITKLED